MRRMWGQPREVERSQGIHLSRFLVTHWISGQCPWTNIKQQLLKRSPEVELGSENSVFIFVTQNTLFGKHMTQNTLFYGFYVDGPKNHNIHMQLENMILGQFKKGENQAKWRVLALKMLKSKCQSGRGSDDSWQKWFSNPSFYDIVDNTSHSTKYATIMVSSDCLAVVLGRFHEKKLLFFWILSKWGGEGLAQIFCHFLGPRGPLIEPSSVHPSTRPRQLFLSS